MGHTAIGNSPDTDFGIGVFPLQILGVGIFNTGFSLWRIDFWGEIWQGNFPSREWSSREEISNQNRSHNDENFIEWSINTKKSPATPFNQGNFLETSLIMKILACGCQIKWNFDAKSFIFMELQVRKAAAVGSYFMFLDIHFPHTEKSL